MQAVYYNGMKYHKNTSKVALSSCDKNIIRRHLQLFFHVDMLTLADFNVFFTYLLIFYASVLK